MNSVKIIQVVMLWVIAGLGIVLFAAIVRDLYRR